MPTLFQDRAGISLYDAQYGSGTKGPVPKEIIEHVLSALLRFKTVCEDFGVPDTNIRVLATEATRTAINSVEYREEIKKATGWEIEMLAKEDEGRIGAMGVASSFSSVKGLVMDLGGGSTQITWMIAEDGDVKTSPKGSMSFPYGAAAMIRLLADAEKQGGDAKAHLREEMKANFQNAYRDLDVPKELSEAAEKDGGFSLYLSGGGFRGWGNLLMSQSSISPYPIPIINGFQVDKANFEDTIMIQGVASEQKVFRVSERRADQVPAVAFLINVLAEALPVIKEVRFCQGGVREGFLYDSLDQEVRAQDPLPVAASPYAPPDAEKIANTLETCLPQVEAQDVSPCPKSLERPLLRALANLMFVHSTHPKESASSAALHTTTTGILAATHGISHSDRALLSLILCERWDGEVSPADEDFKQRLQKLVTPEEIWWCHYVGKVAGLVGKVYPAGVVGHQPRITFHSTWRTSMGKKGLDEGVKLTVKVREGDAMTERVVLRKAIEAIEKVGKKKNHVGGRDGWGRAVEVVLEDR